MVVIAVVGVEYTPGVLCCLIKLLGPSHEKVGGGISLAVSTGVQVLECPLTFNLATKIQ